jgi:hypothetical protein
MDAAGELEMAIAKYLADEHLAAYELARRFTPANCRAVVELLRPKVRALASTEATGRYVQLLDSIGGPSRHAVWKVSFDEAIFDAVADRLATGLGSTSADKQLLGHGINAAVSLAELPTALAWLDRYDTLKFDNPKAVGPITAVHKADLARFRSGEFTTVYQGARAKADAGHGAALTRDELEVLGRVEARTLSKTGVVRVDAATGAALLLRRGGFLGAAYFDGRRFCAPPWEVEVAAPDDRAFVTGSTTCDERVLYASGKTGFHAFQRYGRDLSWLAVSYAPSRDQAEQSGMLWFRTASPEAASALLAQLAATLPAKKTSPFGDAKGPVVRLLEPTGDDDPERDDPFFTAAGVMGRHWVRTHMKQGLVITQSFPTPDDAMAAWDREETARLQRGWVCTRIERFTDRVRLAALAKA